jgi:exodeoxyribonuclease V alpha subunit
VTQPLHPRGTLRARFAPGRGGAPSSIDDEVFRRLGVGARKCDLGDEGLYLAEELVEADRWLGGGDSEALAILVLALMIAQRQGSTRLPLDPKGPLRDLVRDIARVSGVDLDPPRTIKKIVALTSTPQFGSVIGAGDARQPLIVDDGCLYTERSRWLEQRVAARLARRMAAPPRDVAGIVAQIAPEMERGGSTPTRGVGPALSLEQTRAVERALAGALTVITGGPGTGKTVVAGAIVRGFARLGITHVALAAQTGKAANRLTEVIGDQLGKLADPSPADRALAADPPVAQTLHRLLGYRGDRFAHHAQSPLPVGALIIDEASMVDLELMDAVLDALPPTAPLVLIGDAHQLPAIDAGQILADLAEPGGVAAAHVAILEHSYRMDADDPRGRAVLEAAAAVRSGAAQRIADGKLAAARTPGTLVFERVEWVDVERTDASHDSVLAVVDAFHHRFEMPKAQRTADRVVFEFADGRVAPAQAAQLDQLWHQLGRSRILTVTRGLPTGAIAINAFLHARALDRMTVTGRPDFVPGEPVMITANDYQRGLFNGDQGIVVRADEGLGRHHFRAVFRVGGQLVPFAIEALRDRLELAWALTVHKSQGSEVDAACVVLPHDDLPLVTRELLYTAITRARHGVVIVGSRAVLAAAGKRNALRHSGLATRIRAAAAPCAHDVILNGACFHCGTTDLDPVAMSPKQSPELALISADRLTKKPDDR